jgi:signal peptidase II
MDPDKPEHSGVPLATPDPAPELRPDPAPYGRVATGDAGPAGGSEAAASQGASGGHPSFIFLAGLSVLSLGADIATKAWAEKRLDGFPGVINVWKDHIAFVLAKNRGGAWGLLQGTSENVRRPFFLLVSVAAIAFIVTLYRRLLPTQRALKWGLPLVLGGALGNVFDRIRYGHVIDFIDIHLVLKGRDHHWPTFNVADITICVGVGLMAVDMFTSKRPRSLAPLQSPGDDSPPQGAPDASVPVDPEPGQTGLVAAPLPAAPSGEDKP